MLGADRYSIRSGNWNNINTWSATSGGPRTSPPVAGDVVYIESNHSIVVRSADEACSSITFTGDGAELEIRPSRTLNVSGSITLNKQSTSNTGCSIIGDGSLVLP